MTPQLRDSTIATPRARLEWSNTRATRQNSATIFPNDRRWKTEGGDGTEFPPLQFASCFAYLPGGHGQVYEEGRLLCAHLKSADGGWLPQLAAQVWLEVVGHGRFAAAFGRDVVLVPVPGSAPTQCAHWVGERLAWCLREAGLAAEVWPTLRRRYPVRKSAFAAAGERPSVREHYASFAVEFASYGEVGVARHRLARGSAGSRLRLTLVDDVITRGRTLLAAAARIRGAFPAAEVNAFALLRTLARGEVLRRVLDPCDGEVRWDFEDARRRP